MSRDMTKPTKGLDAQAYLSLRWAHIHFVGFVMARLTSWTVTTKPFEKRTALGLKHVSFRLCSDVILNAHN